MATASVAMSQRTAYRRVPLLLTQDNKAHEQGLQCCTGDVLRTMTAHQVWGCELAPA
jgi:hypothetical protein